MAQTSVLPDVPPVTATEPPQSTAAAPSAVFARVVLGSLLVAAGVIHLVMAPAHYGEWATEGVGFAIAGWLQLGLGVLAVVRSRRWVVAGAVAVNALAIVLWVWSRSFGLPFGPAANVADTAGLIDVATVVFEALGIGVGGALLARRLSPGDGLQGAGTLSSLAPLAAIVATTILLVSPSAREHAATGHDHGAASETPAATGDAGTAETTAAHDHSSTATTVAGGTATSTATAPWLDGSGSSSDGAAATTVPVAAGAATADDSTAHTHTTDSATGSTAAPADDKGFSLVMNGHQADAAPVALDPQTTAQLATQLARTAELVAAYPTVADAEAAGYRRNGPFAPGLGAHYGKGGGTTVSGAIDDQNVLNPMLVFNGTEPTSPIVGFMYIAAGSDVAPDGFAGPNDVWHSHTNTCLVIGADGVIDAPLGADHDNVDEALCTQRYGGFLLANTGYMLHVWTVPGWENPLGTFHETHPGITCADGTYWQKTDEEIGFALSTCKDA